MVYFIDLDIKVFVNSLKEWDEKDWSDADMKRLFEYFDQTGKTKVSDLNKTLGTFKKTTEEGEIVYQIIDAEVLFTKGKPDMEKIEKLNEEISRMLKIYFYSMEKKNEIGKDIENGKAPDWLKPALLDGVRLIWENGIVRYVSDGGGGGKRRKKYSKKKKKSKNKGKSKRKRSKTRRR